MGLCYVVYLEDSVGFMKLPVEGATFDLLALDAPAMTTLSLIGTLWGPEIQFKTY